MSYATQNTISLALSQEEVPDRNIFHRAQKSIYSIMENDSMPRFLQSDMSKVVIKEPRQSNNVLFSYLRRAFCKLEHNLSNVY